MKNEDYNVYEDSIAIFLNMSRDGKLVFSVKYSKVLEHPEGFNDCLQLCICNDPVVAESLMHCFYRNAAEMYTLRAYAQNKYNK